MKNNETAILDILYLLSTEYENINTKLDLIKDMIDSLAIGSKDILNFNEAASYLSISRSTLYKLTSQMEVPYSKPNGKLVYFEKKKLDEWLLRNPHRSRQEIEQEAANLILRNKRRF